MPHQCNQKGLKILVTGALGFIGFHVLNKLIVNKCSVVGIDNINDYYDVNQKIDKLELLGINSNLILFIVAHAMSTLNLDK